jgi:hypothetical protein
MTFIEKSSWEVIRGCNQRSSRKGFEDQLLFRLRFELDNDKTYRIAGRT